MGGSSITHWVGFITHWVGTHSVHATRIGEWGLYRSNWVELSRPAEWSVSTQLNSTEFRGAHSGDPQRGSTEGSHIFPESPAYPSALAGGNSRGLTGSHGVSRGLMKAHEPWRLHMPLASRTRAAANLKPQRRMSSRAVASLHMRRRISRHDCIEQSSRTASLHTRRRISTSNPIEQPSRGLARRRISRSDSIEQSSRSLAAHAPSHQQA